MLAALLAAALGVGIGVAAATGGASQTPAELRVQRAQLAYVGRQLLEVIAPVGREVSAARGAWPALAKGMPSHPSDALAADVASADAAARRLPTPPFIEVRHELGGPAARIAGLFHDYEVLSQHSWAHLHQTIGSLMHGPASVASFERANAGLYIDSVYDAHFELSLIGEKVLHSYERLGEGRAFGKALTPGQVSEIAYAYSPASDRLSPHLWRALLAQL